MRSHLSALLLSLTAVTLCKDGCRDIIGGHIVRTHSWPYMCGGALLDKRSVLTAAHCQLKKSEVKLVLGFYQASIAEKYQQIFKVLQYFPNPQFGMSSMENDIVLLKLNSIAKLNKYVQLLPLPVSCEDAKPGTTCKVAGWGVTSTGKPSKYLQETTLEIVGRKSCESKFRNSTKITNNKLRGCGDSGGPLICSSRYSGIVSFGKGCERRDMPGVDT
uniref:Peptidase S1 domain-containing protein n=1 Tax=Athene cunicularia TaxID=194338 RepID=A0A663N7Q6_ATHCN